MRGASTAWVPSTVIVLSLRWIFFLASLSSCCCWRRGDSTVALVIYTRCRFSEGQKFGFAESGLRLMNTGWLMGKWVHSKRCTDWKRSTLLKSRDPEWVRAVSGWGPCHMTTSEEGGAKVGDKMLVEWKDFIALPTILFNESELKEWNKPKPSFSARLPSAHQSPGGAVWPQPFTPALVIFYLSHHLLLLIPHLGGGGRSSLSLAVTFSSEFTSHVQFSPRPPTPSLRLVSPLDSADTRPSPSWRCWQLKWS